MELFMLYPTRKFATVSVSVFDFHIAKLNQARRHVNWVSTVVIYIREIQFQFQILCINVAIQVNGLEITKQHGMTRCVSINITRERRHKRLHKFHICLSHIEVKIQRICHRENGSVDDWLMAILLRQGCINCYALILVVPMALNISITHICLVVTQIIDMQIRCQQFWWLSKNFTCIEHASGFTAKIHIIDMQRFKNIIKVDVFEFQFHFIVRIFWSSAFNVDKLPFPEHVDAIDGHSAICIIKCALLHIPNRIVHHHLRGIDVGMYGYRLIFVFRQHHRC